MPLTFRKWSTVPDNPRTPEDNCFDCGQRSIKLYRRVNGIPNQYFCKGCFDKTPVVRPNHLERLKREKARLDYLIRRYGK